ncbi:MAG: hypothetical protein ABWZ25_02585 [Chitinophagaceae bacterium]
MNGSIIKRLKAFGLTAGLLLLNLVLFAQDKIVIDKSEAESWFMRNWIWVALGALILLILLFSGSSRIRKRSTTTVVKDDYGNVRKVTTTEVED